MKGTKVSTRKAAEQTRNRILRAAAALFDAQGFNGTTVRQIAKEADVNLALISYHFQSKKGLLEVLIATYFESFFEKLAEQEELLDKLQPLDKLVNIVRLYVYFQRDHASITRLIQRELSVETMLAREVMTVYIQRWKHCFSVTVEEGINRGDFVARPVDEVLLAITSLLVYPYLNVQTVREVYYLEPGSDEFCEWLISSVTQLIQSLLLPSTSSTRS